jgi:hypothetical protein
MTYSRIAINDLILLIFFTVIDVLLVDLARRRQQALQLAPGH